jgi:succinate dehydrogenase assembly factor 1
MSKVLSGFQKEVLALYRTLLREAVKKDGASFSETVFKDGTSTAYARREFRKQATEVKRSDFKTIEYKMRKAQKQIKLLQMPGVKVVGGA